MVIGSPQKGGWGGQRLPVSCLWEVLRESHFDSVVLQSMANGSGSCCAGETDNLLYHGRCTVLVLPIGETWNVRVHGRSHRAHLFDSDRTRSSFRQQALEEAFLYYLKRCSISTYSAKLHIHAIVYPSGSPVGRHRDTRTAAGWLRKADPRTYY